ncbi:hypothetical protein [Aquimarina sp. 2201CG5-10]|uniref:hypothetical protein n=1 Tax=Aquimarina callyspongiae TaxID=3098150 RepID=UPI002AB4AB5A|nr:hypothetical protein [Aquimarina sp. 2201CG5-10]MDY8135584.1 hypothetical protein [Aquimarina sp. 2201CG5-10]
MKYNFNLTITEINFIQEQHKPLPSYCNNSCPNFDSSAGRFRLPDVIIVDEEGKKTTALLDNKQVLKVKPLDNISFYVKIKNESYLFGSSISKLRELQNFKKAKDSMIQKRLASAKNEDDLKTMLYLFKRRDKDYQVLIKEEVYFINCNCQDTLTLEITYLSPFTEQTEYLKKRLDYEMFINDSNH